MAITRISLNRYWRQALVCGRCIKSLIDVLFSSSQSPNMVFSPRADNCRLIETRAEALGTPIPPLQEGHYWYKAQKQQRTHVDNGRDDEDGDGGSGNYRASAEHLLEEIQSKDAEKEVCCGPACICR